MNAQLVHEVSVGTLATVGEYSSLCYEFRKRYLPSSECEW
jgi:hypothetical protein